MITRTMPTIGGLGARIALATAALLSLWPAGCAEAPMTAPSGVTMTLFANPPFIVANGGVSVISAMVVEPAGTLVPDGTVVLFFTTLGRIDPQAKTRDGVARASLVADARSGIAQVTAATGDQTVTLTDGVIIGSANPATVIVVADPLRITSPRRSAITANVFDIDGNPIANVPVFFSIFKADPLEETLDSGGRPQYTDTNGQAFDTLRTRAPVDLLKVVTVKATVPNGKEGTVDVGIN